MLIVTVYPISVLCHYTYSNLAPLLCSAMISVIHPLTDSYISKFVSNVYIKTKMKFRNEILI